MITFLVMQLSRRSESANEQKVTVVSVISMAEEETIPRRKASIAMNRKT